MNGRERIALAMQHKIPDRVPVMCQLALGHYFLNTDIPPEVIWFTSEGFAEALVTLQRRYRFDGILINQPGRPDNFLKNVVCTEDNTNGRTLTWNNGDTTFIPWDDNAQHTAADGSRPIVADFMTIDPVDLDFIDDLVGYVWGTYHIHCLPEKTKPGPLSEIPPYFFKTIDLVKQANEEDYDAIKKILKPN